MPYSVKELIQIPPVVENLAAERETFWGNPFLASAAPAPARCPASAAELDGTEARLNRFALFIRRAFPKTAPQDGLIESQLTEIFRMQNCLNDHFQQAFSKAGQRSGNCRLRQGPGRHL